MGPNDGGKTDTPSARFLLSCTPWSNLQLTGRASYSRGISEDSVRDASTLNTLASLNWKIGKSLGTDQYLFAPGRIPQSTRQSDSQ